MQYSPIELKEKLLKGLDKDNNVVDMVSVLEIISILEKYPITRESLEQTRIGKYVNELRKKTSSKDLAKRAKNLVRHWQQLVTTQSAPVNGDGITSRPRPLSGVPQHLVNDGKGSKPGSPVSRPETPCSGRSNLSPASIPHSGTATPVSRPGTPSTFNVQSKLSPKPSAVRLGTSGSKPHSPATNIVSNCTGKKLSLDVPPNKYVPNKDKEVCRPGSPAEGLSKTNVANKRKRRSDDTNGVVPSKKMAISEEDRPVKGNEQNQSYLKQEPLVNGIVSDSYHQDTSQNSAPSPNTHQLQKTTVGRQLSPAYSENSDRTSIKSAISSRRNANVSVRADHCDKSQVEGTPSERYKLERLPSGASLRTPKVKTTAQLIQELHASGGLRLTASETVTKIALNQIEKEEDVPDVSVVPPEAKPRPRRKPGLTIAPPSMPNESLSKTKTEMVQKFLQSSITPTSSVVDLVGLGGKELELYGDNVPVQSAGEQFLAQLEPAAYGPPAAFSSAQKSDQQSMDEHDGARELVGGSTLGDETAVNGSRREGSDISPDHWSKLPPLDLDSINWDEDHYDLPPVVETDDSTVERLNSENWTGVNGQFDHHDVWHDWTQTYSMPTYNNDLLHLLPYVNVDD